VVHAAVQVEARLPPSKTFSSYKASCSPAVTSLRRRSVSRCRLRYSSAVSSSGAWSTVTRACSWQSSGPRVLIEKGTEPSRNI